jgi:hypothetical protein
MDSWGSRLIGAAAAAELAGAVERLFEQQRTSWPLLARGLAGLRQSRTRTLRIGPHSIAVRHIPHRLKSTTAPVDVASIGARPCFLCLQDLPPEQRGVAIGEEWVALCNPFPILERHLTIVHREHVPQRLSGRIGALLVLAQALPTSFLIYNGPECGASAPDHLHFQACDRSLFPIDADTRDREGPVVEHPSRPIVLRDDSQERLAARLERLLLTLAERTPRPGEPLVNLAVFEADGRFTVYVFVRRRHRPGAFQRGELLLSPAAVDLCGVLVAPRAEDYERLTGELVAGILDEVLVDRSELRALAERSGART